MEKMTDIKEEEPTKILHPDCYFYKNLTKEDVQKAKSDISQFTSKYVSSPRPLFEADLMKLDQITEFHELSRPTENLDFLENE